ncbi:MAG: alpha/beta fold hydrolase [Candidatus Baltobacteraceae bacterium]
MLSAILALTLGLSTPPQPVTRHFVSHHATLTYQTYGGGTTPWVVLAGGPGYDPRYMLPLVKLLGDSHKVVLLNQRGTGASRSAAVDSTQLTVDGAVADLEALRVALHVQKLHLIGHSWGGYLALAYAAQHPKNVAALVLLDSLGDDPRSWLPVTDQMMAALTPQERHNARIACTSLRPAAACDIAEVPSFFFDQSKMPAFLQSVGPGEIDNVPVNDTMTFDIMSRPHLNALRGLTIPTLMLFGVADPYRHPAQHDLAALLPQAQIVVIPRAGHFTWFEQPAAFLRAVDPFLNAHSH